MTLRAFTSAWAGVCVAMALGWSAPADDDDEEKPTYTIKQVMKQAHKEGLFKKVVGGKASNDEKAKLLELYQALEKNKPPKGNMKDWVMRTKPIVAAAQDVVDGKEGAGKKLETAVNCLDCHKAHRK